MKLLKTGTLALLGLIVLGLFLYGITELMMMRFRGGDIYPPYSSLRSDPLGTRAFYESLRSCCSVKVSRNYDDTAMIKERHDAALLVLGVAPEDLYRISKVEMDHLNYMIRHGARLVIILGPQRSGLEDEESPLGFVPEVDETTVSLQEEWGFRVNDDRLKGIEGKGTAQPVAPELKDAEPITCYTSLYFDRLPAWRVIYRRGIHPVIVERKFGSGSIVLSSVSYFVSNEGLLRQRRPQLLSWLIGDKKEVIFDEAYHGVFQQHGTAYLIGKYRLWWLVGGFLLLSALFVWKNAAGLVPSSSSFSRNMAEVARGKESAAGLTNLLRRSIPAREIFFVGYQEWITSPGSQSAVLKPKIDRIQGLVNQERGKPPRERNGTAVYNSISRILKER